ncbi:MAG TPA: hypothetical protein VNK92_03195, partial [Vicinamibacterales bacterium]|nr:hypothetical protein [Vicinamibacterales bacterium]
LALRFGLEPFAEPSTRAGRRYARPAAGAEVVGVALVRGDETVVAATRRARAMLCPVREINFLSGPGRGVTLIKLQGVRRGAAAQGEEADRVLGFVVARGDRDVLTVETSRGGVQTIGTGKYEVTGRGGRGRELLQRGHFTRVVPPPPELPSLGE